MVDDTPENYAATPHIENDEIITVDEYNMIERTINAHAVFWIQMLQVAKNSGDAQRYRMSMVKENSQYSTLYTYRKDHKPYEDRNKGPPVRPLCDVSDSYGHRLSYFISNILKEVSDDEPTVCDSTEDMLAAVKETNDSGKMNSNVVIGSLDVKALYPSLDLDFTIDVVSEEFYQSKVNMEGIDYEELGLYLSLNRDEEYLRSKGLLKYCPRRRSNRGAPPKITSSGISVKKEERFKPWTKPSNEPKGKWQRLMMKEALKVVLNVIMKNHVYNFNNELRKQKEGGAIGMDITGELAKVFMTWWDKQAIRKLREMDIDPILYKRYVDDINVAAETVKRGVEYIDGQLVRSKKPEDDENGPKDMRTFDIIRKICNEIHSSIQLTADVPSKHQDNKVPILDLKCWTEEIEQNGHKKYMILHEHYIKDVSSKAVIHRESALSLSSKRTILTQECLRIMMNCSTNIGWEVITEHLSFFMARMQAAQYDQSFRLQVLKSALNAYKKKKECDAKGGTPFYRNRQWKRNERRREKEKKKKDWYKRGGKESVMFISATPNSRLKDLLQKEIDKTPYKIRVVEKSGTKLIKLLQKNDPFKTKTCRNREECMVCSGSKPGGCRDSGVTYRINCLGCKGVYKGETGKNGFSRGKKHHDDYVNKRDVSAMWKHCILKHEEQEQQFEMVIEDRSRNDPTKRQILEAVRIQKVPKDLLMNGKSEWNSARIPRAMIHTSDR